MSHVRIKLLLQISAFVLGFVVSTFSVAQSTYLVQPGDTLQISVWKEPDLTGPVTVHPDGTFTMPLIGQIAASKRTSVQIGDEITEKLIKFVPDAVVSVGLQDTVGSSIYVIGQVNRPGVFVVKQPTDVMQALSLAQGMTAYASKNKIKILRRENGEQKATGFRYGDVAKGSSLEQNILLQNGDVVVVP